MFWPTLSSTRSTANPEFVVVVVSCKGLPGKQHIKDTNGRERKSWRWIRNESLSDSEDGNDRYAWHCLINKVTKTNDFAAQHETKYNNNSNDDDNNNNNNNDNINIINNNNNNKAPLLATNESHH